MAHFVASAPIPADQTAGDEATQAALVSGQTMTINSKPASGGRSSGHFSSFGDTGLTHTKTYTIPKLKPGGTTGSVTFTNGQVTAYTAPT